MVSTRAEQQEKETADCEAEMQVAQSAAVGDMHSHLWESPEKVDGEE